MFRSMLNSERFRAILCWLTANYIRLVFWTSRFEVVNGSVPAAFWDTGKPFILAFWHGRIAVMPYCWRRGAPINMMISRHRDGDIIARTIQHFDMKSIRGSSANPSKARKRGGEDALRGMIRALKASECVGITPDGPRGPRMRAGDGVAAIARITGVPVIPCGASTRAGIVHNSWDRFLVPLPFTRGVFVWGEPITVEKGASAETLAQATQQIEDSLNGVTLKADRMVGRAPIEPAPRLSAPAGAAAEAEAAS
ncbi:MAG: DUF374 domain-containing protein [Alphaproteobacteria bacterium]|nr:DUF374 domain-containing protein [Alphaproteobacteria bacterium]